MNYDHISPDSRHVKIDDNNYCIYNFEEEIHGNPSYTYYDEITNHSSHHSSFSVDNMDVECFGSDGSMSTQDQNSPEHVTIIKDLDLTRNPTNRKPLVSLDVGRSANQNKEQTPGKLDIETPETKQYNSWLSSTLCAASASFTFDSFDEKIKNREGPNYCNYNCVDLDDYEVKNVFPHFLNDTNEIADDQIHPPLIDKAILLKDQTFKDEADENEQSLKIFGSIDTFFRHNNILCNSLESWYLISEKEKVETSTPRNSSINPTARKKKIKHLEQNLSPFDIHHMEFVKGSLNLNKYSTAECGTIRKSFSNVIIKTPPKRTIHQEEVPLSVAKVGECTPLVDTSCGTLADTQHLALVTTEEEEREQDETSFDENEGLFFDSDPSNLASPRHQSSERVPHSRKRRHFVPFSLSSINEEECTKKVRSHTFLRLQHIIIIYE